MELKFKKLNEKAVLPTRSHSTDAGLDLTTYGFTQEVDASGKLVLVYQPRNYLSFNGQCTKGSKSRK